MTNEELFETFARKDFNRLKDLLDKGYTETSDFKSALEMLHSSIEALLRDMDMETYMDKIEFVNEELIVQYEGKNYKVKAAKGCLLGYATMNDTDCVAWDTEEIHADIKYEVETENGFIPYSTPSDSDPFGVVMTSTESYLYRKFMAYLESKHGTFIKEIA